MHHTDLRSHLIRLSTIPFMTVSLMTVLLPPKAAQAANPYQVCAESLLEAGIANVEAADACAAALEPRDLSRCVTNITRGTEILATDALSGCRQVRRPEDLGNCVVDINGDADDAVALNVLDYCRRSVLPERYSDCVTGLVGQIEITTALALDTCISASNLPRNVLPSFIPRTEEQLELNPSVPPAELPETLPFRTSPLIEESPTTPPLDATPTTPLPTPLPESTPAPTP